MSAWLEGIILSEDSKLHDFLAELLRRGGSDLLLVHGAAAAIRKNGEVEKIGDAPLDGSEIESLVEPILTPVGAAQYRDTQIADSSYRVPGLGRFRINLHRERGHAAATIRALPVKVPAIGELGLPSEVGNLAGIRRGLVLIGGAAGAGKSTTLAALVNEINQRDARHIVTIEDPVEYEHAHVRSIIEQVEVGTDAPDFPQLFARRCARRRMCSWSARCAIRRAWPSLFRPPKPGISCYRLCTPLMWPQRSLASPIRSRWKGRIRYGRNWQWRSQPF